MLEENGSKQMKLFNIQWKESNLVKILVKTSINPLGYVQCGNYFLTYSDLLSLSGIHL